MTGSPTWQVLEGDALDRLREMPDESVQTCVTSPPYFGLRDYGVEGQIGLEPTPDEYVARLVEVFREVRRVLRDDGTLWLNLGDSYAGSWGAQSRNVGVDGISGRQVENHPKRASHTGTIRAAGVKPKDLFGIPWLVAFALRADGWYLRSDIIWNKPNPMPESVTDRPTRSHEYLFLLAKSQRYFYDAEAVREPHAELDRPQSEKRREQRMGRSVASVNGLGQSSKGIDGGAIEAEHTMQTNPAGRNKRSVWTITTKPFSWKGNDRRVRVAPDEAGDDTTRIPSADCPVHGGRFDPAPTVGGGGRAGDDPSHTERSDARHVQGSLDGLGSTDPPREQCSGDGSLGSPLPAGSPTATRRNTESRRTDLDPATSPPCTPSDETAGRTGGTPRSRGSAEPRANTPESSSAPAGSDARPSARTADGTVRSSSCTCEYYRLEPIDHFATFPPDLVEPCILAGSSPQACGECGAPWERVVEREPNPTKNTTGPSMVPIGAKGETDARYRSHGASLASPPPQTLGWQPTCTHEDGSGSSVVLDPFAGAGTTGLVALRHDRSFIGIELSPTYCELARQRIRDDQPLFNTPAEAA